MRAAMAEWLSDLGLRRRRGPVGIAAAPGDRLRCRLEGRFANVKPSRFVWSGLGTNPVTASDRDPAGAA